MDFRTDVDLKVLPISLAIVLDREEKLIFSNNFVQLRVQFSTYKEIGYWRAILF